VSGLAPRALEDIVRPRRSSDVVVRPLNFTVRSHFGRMRRREESPGVPSMEAPDCLTPARPVAPADVFV
jgi:hypothetical protein